MAISADFRYVEAEEKPSNKSKKGGAKGSVALLKESTQLGCVSQDRENLFHVKEGKSGSNHTVYFYKGTWHHKKFGKEKVHHEELFKSASLTSAARAPPSLRRGHKMKPCIKKSSPRSSMGIGKKVSTSSESEKRTTKLRFTLLLKPGQRRRPLQNLQKKENSWLIPDHQCTC